MTAFSIAAALSEALTPSSTEVMNMMSGTALTGTLGGGALETNSGSVNDVPKADVSAAVRESPSTQGLSQYMNIYIYIYI